MTAGAQDRQTQGALEGVRILDLTRVWAGPLATRMLADLGAEVVKIEAPGARGPAGRIPTADIPDPWNRNSNFNDLNRNKLGLTLDLGQEAGKGVFRALVPSADVVIENYSPRVMGNLGLDFAALVALNPRIILVSMPGYGLDGPLRDYVAFGTSLDAESGTSTLMGYPGEGPERLGVAFPDHAAGVHAVGAVITALLQREQTGAGLHVDLSQFESMATFVADETVAAQMRGGPPPRIGNRHPSYVRGVYPCAGQDRWISIAVRSDHEWAGLTRVLGAPQLAVDPRFITNALRMQHHDEIDQVISAWTRHQEPGEAMTVLQADGVSAGAVLDAEGLFNDPHLRERGFFVSQDHATAGLFDYPGLPIRMSGTAATYRRAAPMLGEHNGVILRDWLGYDDERIAALQAAAVVVDRPPA